MLPDPTKPLDVVSLFDEGLDSESMDTLAYLKHHDPALIIDKSEMAKAARFTLVPIPFAWMCKIDDGHPNSTPGRYREALLASCRSVTLPGGEVLKPSKLLDMGEGVQVAHPSWLQIIAARFGMRIMYDVGSTAYLRSRLATEAVAPLG